MGQNQSATGNQDLDYYVIRLKPDQSVTLYGYLRAQTTLTWKDALANPTITLKSCCECGVDSFKLCRMQPDIREWMRHNKAGLEDCALMGPWKPDVFNDLGCSIGDLVMHRKALGPDLLLTAGITFDTLKNKYGLTPELMAMLHYSSEDWLKLRVCDAFLKELTDEQWVRIFGSTQTRCETIESAKRRRA